MKIVVLPGLDGTGHLLAEFAASLRKSYPVEIISYPLGMTSCAEISEWIGFRLPQDESVIVAESFSGPVAIEIMEGRAHGLRATVFVASFARAPGRVPQSLVGLPKHIPHSPGLAAVASKPFVVGSAAPASFSSAYRSVLKKGPWSTVVDRLCAVSRVDYRDKLSEASVPCAYLRATKDKLVPARISEDFNKHCQMLPIEAPHFVLQTKPDEAAECISRFVASL